MINNNTTERTMYIHKDVCELADNCIESILPCTIKGPQKKEKARILDEFLGSQV